MLLAYFLGLVTVVLAGLYIETSGLGAFSALILICEAIIACVLDPKTLYMLEVPGAHL